METVLSWNYLILPKIPYLLAAAAAAAASNHRQSQQLDKFHQSQILVSQNSINDSCEKNNLKKDSKQDQEYLHIVSMLKEKNEKHFNPLVWLREPLFFKFK